MKQKSQVFPSEKGARAGKVKQLRFIIDNSPSDVFAHWNEQGMEGLSLASHGPRETHTAKGKWKARQGLESARLCA